MILMKEAKQIIYDKAYLRMALEWGKLSYCERKQVGAIVVRDRMIISDGYNGTPIGITPPNFVELEITDTDPGLKGDTAQGGTKPATLETGAVIKVPLFLEIGELVRVDTRTGDYMSRVKK